MYVRLKFPFINFCYLMLNYEYEYDLYIACRLGWMIMAENLAISLMANGFYLKDEKHMKVKTQPQVRFPLCVCIVNTSLGSSRVRLSQEPGGICP